MNKIHIVSIVLVVIALLILSGGYPFFTSSPTSPDKYKSLGDILSDTSDLTFDHYSEGDSIPLKDKISSAQYNSSSNITHLKMKSYSKKSILFRGNILTTHKSNLTLEGSHIIYTIHILQQNGIEYIKEFYNPIPEVK